MSEHVLVRMARSLGAPPDQQDRVAATAARLDAQLAEALGCTDPALARGLLPAAVHALAVATRDLVGGGLAPGSAWFDAAHAQLYARAVALFGRDAEQIVPRPHVEPMPAAVRPFGRFLPRP